MKTVPPRTVRQRVRRGLRAAAVRAGLCDSSRGPGGAAILMYHSVAAEEPARFIDPAWHLTPATFERQVAWLARNRQVVALGALVRTLRSGCPPAPGTVVITFDDGYLDNLEVAAPILARHGLPATLFLATGYVDRAAPQWVDRLYTAFLTRRERWLPRAAGGADLDAPRQRLAAYGDLSRQLLAADPDARDRILSQLERSLGSRCGAPRLTLTWDDVRTLVERHPRWEIGAHGARHLDLAAQGEAEIRRDLADCMDAIARATGSTPIHLSFPYGRSSATARAIARAHGLQSAVAAGGPALVDTNADPLDMGRIDAGQPLVQIAFWTGGARHGLPRRLAGAA